MLSTSSTWSPSSPWITPAVQTMAMTWGSSPSPSQRFETPPARRTQRDDFFLDDSVDSFATPPRVEASNAPLDLRTSKEFLNWKWNIQHAAQEQDEKVRELEKKEAKARR